jgi:hypothetical protein
MYAISVPFFAENFYNNNTNTSLYIILSCLTIAFLLYSGRVLFFNILIAFYVLKQYLTRPYLDIFHDKLDPDQLSLILTNDVYFNSERAEIVYFSLLMLLLAWTIGLFIFKSKKPLKPFYPWIFRKIDELIRTPNWKFILVWLVITFYSTLSSDQLFKSAFGVEGKVLLGYGLITNIFISYGCLAHYMYSKHIEAAKVYIILLVPVAYGVSVSVMAGGRGALYNLAVFVLLYWVFLNFNRNIIYKDVMRLIVLVLMIPVILFSAAIAQTFKIINKSNSFQLDNKLDINVYEEFIRLINIFNPENLYYQTIYFNLTELFHRLGHLEVQFWVLNDRYLNLPGETFNVFHIFMRTINDLVPGIIFHDVISINRLYHHIYLDEFTHYSSHTWGIQGVMYILFGSIGSIIFVVLIAMLISRYYAYFQYLVLKSPTLYLFITFMTLTILEKGVIESVFVVDIIRPLISMLFFIFMVKILDFFVPINSNK